MAKRNQSDQDRRIAARRKVLLRAEIIAKSSRHYTIPCILKDVSETGCQIVGTMIDGIKGEFFLKSDLFPEPRVCVVSRRERRIIGARFQDAKPAAE
jgi:hypothetical protein